MGCVEREEEVGREEGGREREREREREGRGGGGGGGRERKGEREEGGVREYRYVQMSLV